MSKLLEVRNLKNHFPILSPLLKRRKGYIKAVDGVSFALGEGKNLGIVGESGCGKTTLGRTILQILKPTGGEIIFQGKNIANQNDKVLKPLRSKIQMIFQDPYSSLNPKHKVKRILEEPVKTYHPRITKKELNHKIATILKEVSLNIEDLNKYPHEFSGGQRQRIAIARTLILNPKLIVADEPVSALDVSVQAQIINLLKRLQKSLNISFLFISHDLSVVEHIVDEVAVMYLGKIVEIGDKKEIFTNPLHPYTQKLIESIPVIDPNHKRKRVMIEGETPSPQNYPSGCNFHTRCPFVKEECKTKRPALKTIKKNQQVSCHLY